MSKSMLFNKIDVQLGSSTATNQPEALSEIQITNCIKVYGPDTYRQTSYISHILEDNQLVDLSDAVGASPVDAAPSISSFST